MADKAFNEKPMVVVVADGLDPRAQRQLKAQLQAEMMTISEVEAEIKNQEAAENIKQQLDSVKDDSKFDDNEVKENTPPEPVEDTQNATSQPSPAADGESGTEGQPSGEAAGNGEQNDDVFGSDTNTDNGAGTKAENPEPNPQGSQEGQNPQPGNGDTPAAQPPASNPPAENNGGENGTDPFTGEPAGVPDADQKPQTPVGGTPAPAQPPAGQGSPQQASPNASASNANDGSDPFTDDSPTFEAFAGILGLEYKQEDASSQTKAETPPLKQLVYIRASDQGVDQRTSAVIATLEDPQNTVVVIDLSDVGEVESKMQFSSMKKQLQERGITVLESIDQAIEFLNDVYEQISGGAKDE